MRLGTSGSGKGSFDWRCAGGRKAKEIGSAGLKPISPQGSLLCCPRRQGQLSREHRSPHGPGGLVSITFLQRYQGQHCKVPPVALRLGHLPGLLHTRHHSRQGMQHQDLHSGPPSPLSTAYWSTPWLMSVGTQSLGKVGGGGMGSLLERGGSGGNRAWAQVRGVLCHLPPCRKQDRVGAEGWIGNPALCGSEQRTCPVLGTCKGLL